jgi:predicted O-methyltransferase YrrM
MNQAGFTPIIAQPRRWDVLASFMVEQGYKTFVEVGAKEGRTTGHILKNVPDSRVIAIDPWMADPAPANGDKTREDYKAWDFAKIEAEFWSNVGDDHARARCAMLRMTSEKAASIIETDATTTWVYKPIGEDAATAECFGPIDLVFIDALHDYESVKQDIALWWPKVRIGGMLCGHDFNHKWPGCERAVAESFNLMHIGVASDSVWFIVKTSEAQFRGTPNAHTQEAA